MPRRIGDELNELRIQDNISNSTIVLYYRMPTTEETVAYTNEMTSRRRNKLISRLGETRQKYGLRILEGYRRGDFEKKVGKKYVPFDSDPDSKHHAPDWKKLVKVHAPDLVELLARHVFESAAEVEEAEEEIAVEKPGEDLEKN